MPARQSVRKKLNKPPGRPPGAKSFDPVQAQAFGDAIKEARSGAQMSQEALALISNVERSYLGRLERGQSMPTLMVILKLCRALEISSGKLIEQVDLATADSARRRLLRRLAKARDTSAA